MRYLMVIFALGVVAVGVSMMAEESDTPKRSEAIAKVVAKPTLDELNQQVITLYKQGKHQEAMRLAEEIERLGAAETSGNVKERFTEKEKRPTLKELNQQVITLYKQGMHREAIVIAEKVVRRSKLENNSESASHASYLNNLAVLYVNMGSYDKALPLYLEAKTIRKKALGVDHSDYATSLNNLAALYQTMGSYEKALPLYVEAKAIFKKTLGADHPSYAASLNNLAYLYQVMGSYEKALPLHLEVISIKKKALGVDHSSYASSLNNLAALYSDMGSYDKALPLYLEAIKIDKKALGVDHPDYAASLNNLASLYQDMGSYEKAEPWYLEAKAIHKKAFGVDHSSYASSLNNLADLYQTMGSYEKALPLLLESKAIRKKALGADHPSYATSLRNLAILYCVMGSYEKALPLYMESLRISRDHLDGIFWTQTEAAQLSFASTKRVYLDSYLYAVEQHGFQSKEAYEQYLNWKGAILIRQKRMHAVFEKPALSKFVGELRQLSREIATASRMLDSGQHTKVWREKLEALRTKKEALIRDLVAKDPDFRKARQVVTVKEVAESMPVGSVLIDFAILYGNQLIAFVIKQDGRVSLHDLGELKPIQAAIKTWRSGEFGQSKEAQEAGRQLKDKVWQPLVQAIGDAKLILISKDGVLGHLPFEAMPGSQAGHYLLEDHAISYVPVPALLPEMMRREKVDRLKKKLLVMGNVDYNDDGVKVAPKPSTGRLQSLQSVGMDLRRGMFDPLKYTEKEMLVIKEAFAEVFPAAAQVQTIVSLEEEKATEARFREEAPHCYYLHLATHGFFAKPQPKPKMAKRGRAIRGQLFKDQEKTVSTISPYLLSGLAFAGANKPPQEGRDDGILTAEELAFMALNKTDLATLSACETGLGEMASGEGLLGLQRAIQISGCKSTVASLWKVDDFATRMLMERFYENLWSKKMSKLDALREAQLWLLNHPKFIANGIDRGAARLDKDGKRVQREKRHELNGRTAPIYWAAFQLSGDWR